MYTNQQRNPSRFNYKQLFFLRLHRQYKNICKVRIENALNTFTSCAYEISYIALPTKLQGRLLIPIAYCCCNLSRLLFRQSNVGKFCSVGMDLAKTYHISLQMSNSFNLSRILIITLITTMMIDANLVTPNMEMEQKQNVLYQYTYGKG